MEFSVRHDLHSNFYRKGSSFEVVRRAQATNGRVVGRVGCLVAPSFDR